MLVTVILISVFLLLQQQSTLSNDATAIDFSSHRNRF